MIGLKNLLIGLIYELIRSSFLVNLLLSGSKFEKNKVFRLYLLMHTDEYQSLTCLRLLTWKVWENSVSWEEILPQKLKIYIILFKTRFDYVITLLHLLVNKKHHRVEACFFL